MKTPSQELSEVIVDKIIKSGLISADDSQKLIGKIAEGKMQGSDWRLAVENQLAKEKKNVK